MATPPGRGRADAPGPSAVLERLVAFGPYFAVGTHDAGQSPPAGWSPLAELLGDRGALLDRVRAVRGALAAAARIEPAAVELRVAASVTQLGLAARLLSPMIGMAVVAGASWELDPAHTWWQPGLGSAFPLSAPAAAVPGVPDLPASALPAPPDLRAAVLHGAVAGLTAELGRLCSVSPTVLWGNVGSALNAAVTVIARTEPGLGDRATAVVARILSAPVFGPTPVTLGPAYRRHSCCLIYRVGTPDRSAVCGDCVLNAAPAVPGRGGALP